MLWQFYYTFGKFTVTRCSPDKLITFQAFYHINKISPQERKSAQSVDLTHLSGNSSETDWEHFFPKRDCAHSPPHSQLIWRGFSSRKRFRPADRMQDSPCKNYLPAMTRLLWEHTEIHKELGKGLTEKWHFPLRSLIITSATFLWCYYYHNVRLKHILF